MLAMAQQCTGQQRAVAALIKQVPLPAVEVDHRMHTGNVGVLNDGVATLGISAEHVINLQQT